MDFQAWPKIPRLFRDMIITEKIDGTNACIIIEALQEGDAIGRLPEGASAQVTADSGAFNVYCQSRKRIIQPNDVAGKGADNFGFAAWVRENAEALVKLGSGRHYGEWWGGGIQSGYGLAGGAEPERYFSLFNPFRYKAQLDGGVLPDNVRVVPVLETYTFDHGRIQTVLNQLRESGSVAARQVGGSGAAEGIIVYHTAAKQHFKVTLENDEKPKGQA